MWKRMLFLPICFLCGGLFASGYRWQHLFSLESDIATPLIGESKGTPIVYDRDVPAFVTREEFLSLEERNRIDEAIDNWKPGDALSEILLSFPHFKGKKGVIYCGFGLQGESVEDHIYGIQNEELLKALILEPRTDDRAFNAALRKLLRSHSLNCGAVMLAELRHSRPGLVGRSAFALALKDYESPCIHLRIARFDKNCPIALTEARDVLQMMQKQLQAGEGWKLAYGKASEAMRDWEHNKPGEDFHGPTHLSYAYEGRITLEYRDLIDGYDLRTYQYASIPAGHLEAIFQEKGGTHVIETQAAIWLYYVEDYYPGSR